MLQRSIEHRPVTDRRVLAPAAPRGYAAETDALVDILRCLRRNAKLIAAVTLVGSAIAVGVVLSITPQYRANVAILVDSRQTRLLQDAEVVGRPGTDNGAIESEVELLQSDALTRQVADKLDLRGDDEFGAPDGFLARLKSVILLPVRLISGSRSNGDPLAAVTDRLRKATSARRRGLTYVIELNAWSRDAEKSARIANAFAKLYLADQLAAKADATRRASEWLNARVEEMRGRVAASEKALETYKAEAGLFDPGGENLSDRQIGQLNDQLVDARAKAAAARSKYEQLRQVTPERLRSAAASTDVLQSMVVSNLRGQYADAARQQAEREARYGPQHPQVVSGRAQVANLDRQISAEINRIVTSAKNEYEAAVARQESLQMSLDDLKDKAAQVNQAGVRLRELDRDVTANRDLFQSFLARAKQTSELSLQIPDSRIVSPARVPTAASYPKKGLVVGLGLFGSLGLGIAFALGRDAIGRGFRRPADLERAFGLQPLAAIPHVTSQDARRGNVFGASFNLRALKAPTGKMNHVSDVDISKSDVSKLGDVMLEQPDSAFSESIRALYLGLKQQSPDRRIGVVLVTSALPGEGKSTVALNLARMAAQAGDNVLLIDGDLRRPALAAALRQPGEQGLADLLAGDTELQSAVWHEARTNLYAIAGRRGVSGVQAIALLVSPRMRLLMHHARDIFDLVVIDASPVLPVADTRLLLEHADGAVMVVASERTSRDAVTAALHENPELADKVVGVVLNGARDEFERYYGEAKPVPVNVGA
jgi:exopolysaccharide transport family protein